MNRIKAALKKYWGYDEFLPLQEQAIGSVIAGRDSVVVMPTGGGKSICFQAPAVTLPGLAIVISPLISLMKDQVDALTECGVPAARLDSTRSAGEQNAVKALIRKRELKLLYISPERIVSPGFFESLDKPAISLIAVDEAHCVSMWGHDFRPEYRQLGFLKQTFPQVAIHAYTATATERVRKDIATQLRLDNPEVLVGSFDRPNLVYKVERRRDGLNQVCAVLDRHQNETGIIYCIRRADVDEMCAALAARGYNVAPYHAGMEDEDRKRSQEAFIREKVATIVATIAFGMGIDKSNVRYVIHTGMPKSLEHYQQQSGRAGRDGLEAECSLFYSGADYGVWKYILRDSEPEAGKIALAKLNDIYHYCAGVTCRHRAILNYFGQDLDKDDCGACDVCLGDLDCVENPLEIGQKVISCILRLGERFGADHTTLVLSGSRDERILKKGHDALSTYGLLSDFKRRVVRDWVEQLVAQGYVRKAGEFNVLNVTGKGRRLLEGTETPRLLKPAEKKRRRISRAARDSWEGVDENLFEALRSLRRQIADRKHVPAFHVFSDATLRDMARLKPATPEGFLEVRGVGEMKCEQYSTAFLAAIRQHRDGEQPGPAPLPQTD